MSVLQELQARGYIEATTHTEELEEYLKSRQGAFYVGFDPTGDSL
ncbi:MAG: tyrosine--tRNA ligase, partial [Desulfobacterales bacterium]